MRGFGAQNLLLENENTPDLLVAMFTSCNSNNMGLQVPHLVGGLEDALVTCGQKRFFYPSFIDGSPQAEEAGDEDGNDDCSPNVEKKRRLTFEQVRSLERNFEVENKLEPEKKMQLAKELGLQPRQVAVWFQNRRARWKTKQLERDYEILSLNYDKLKAEYDAILLEKEKLKTQIQHLTRTAQPDTELHGSKTVEPSLTGGKRATPWKFSCADSESAKAERRASPAVEICSKREEKVQTTSSDSNSSEILDTDSPRIINTGYKVPLMQATEQVTICPQTFVPESLLDPSLLHITGDNLCGHVMSPQVYCQRVGIKLEDSNCQDDQSCNYFLSQLDDKAATPWWDWA